MKWIEIQTFKLYYDKKKGGSGEIFFQLFNKNISITIDENVDLKYAEDCVDYLKICLKKQLMSFVKLPFSIMNHI